MLRRSARLRTLMKQPNHSQRQLIRIDILPDDVLLEIFDFYMDPPYGGSFKSMREKWQPLIHVCQRWKRVVLASPRRLNLQLYCTPDTPVRDTLDVWPDLPLIIGGRMASSLSKDNLIAAFEQSNRVCEVTLSGGIAGWQMEEVLAAMQVPFPELTSLALISHGKMLLGVPDSFLGGSAPRLRRFGLSGIPFPGLPRLHLCAPHLIRLDLSDIPHSGYFSPEVIVALLSALPGLEDLVLGFRSPQSFPDREFRRPPPPKLSLIPALGLFVFTGVAEYLEGLVTLIDTPRLGRIIIRFFDQIDFDTPRLAQFINRTFFYVVKSDAHLQFYYHRVDLRLKPWTLEIEIFCGESDRQLLSIAQVCNSSLHPLSTVEDLYIERDYRRPVWKGDLIENTLWLQVLLPFTAVKNLYLDNAYSQGIAATLKGLVGGRITEVLPNLENIFVAGLRPSGRFQETIGQFVAARQLSDHPITISDWGAS